MSPTCPHVGAAGSCLLSASDQCSGAASSQPGLILHIAADRHIPPFHSPLYHCDSDSDAAELRAGGHVAAASCDADTDHGAAFCIDSRLNSIWSLIKSSIKDLLYLK